MESRSTSWHTKSHSGTRVVSLLFGVIWHCILEAGNKTSEDGEGDGVVSTGSSPSRTMMLEEGTESVSLLTWVASTSKGTVSGSTGFGGVVCGGSSNARRIGGGGFLRICKTGLS